MHPQQRSRSPKRRTHLDAVLPTAVEVLDRKREAMRVLRAIDALLLAVNDDSGDVASKKTRRDERVGEHVRASGANAVPATPGPGAYSPAGLIGHCMKFEGYSDRTRPTLPWRLATKDRTPGSGAYAAASADSFVKPRVFSAVIPPLTSRSGSARANPEIAMRLRSEAIEVAPTPQATTFKSKSLVAYKAPTLPSFRTREQQLKVRAMLAARKRWPSVGCYNVQYAAVERRLGATGIVPMARQSASGKKTTAHLTQFRRKLRLWIGANAAQVESGGDNGVNGGTARPSSRAQAAWRHSSEAYKRTEQWRRAQARRLMRDRPLDQQTSAAPEHLTPSGYTMRNQLGRDVVQCRQPKQRVVTSFSAAVRPEHAKRKGRGSKEHSPARHSPRTNRGSRPEPFALTTGRDEVHVDALGMHYLGAEADRSHRTETMLNLDAAGAAVRPRTVSTIVSTATDRFPRPPEHTTRLELEPKYSAVKPSVRGHRFVRFERQTDRPALVSSSTDEHHTLVLPSSFPVIEALKYSASHVSVSYSTMRGRGDSNTVDSRDANVSVPAPHLTSGCSSGLFLDPTRDSVTTRHLLLQQQRRRDRATLSS